MGFKLWEVIIKVACPYLSQPLMRTEPYNIYFHQYQNTFAILLIIEIKYKKEYCK